MDGLSECPRSFKLERGSSLASKLKDAIAEKLTDFLGNYTDDVLAEYIIVLVCNGKNQIQARDDLEAFLGERNEEFVSWLWDLILKHSHRSKPALDGGKEITSTSASDDLGKKQRSSGFTDPSTHPIGDGNSLLTKDENFCGLLSRTYNQVPLSDDSQCISSPLNEVYNKEARTSLHQSDILRKSEKRENNHNEALKCGSLRMRPSHGIPADDEQSAQDVDPYKMVNGNYRRLPQQVLYSPKRELVSRNLRSPNRESIHPGSSLVANVIGTRLSSRVAGAASHQNVKPRGNVWDRLGKPCEDNMSAGDGMIDAHSVDVIKRKTLVDNGEGLDQDRLMLRNPDGRLNIRVMGEVSVLGNKRDIFISKTNECRKPDNHATVIRRKRQIDEINLGSGCGSVSLAEDKDKNFKDKKTYKEFKRSSSVKCSQLRNMNSVVPESRKLDNKNTNHALRYEAAIIQSQKSLTKDATDISPTRTLIPVCSPLVSKSESTSIDENANLSLKPVESQVLDVKLRLHEIEKEMSKLRSKQLEMNNSGKINLLSSSGASNHHEEDIVSRTVYVTNVHFAATKEALSLYFSKCGAVIKVLILTDILTGQPKGSAYITFDSKESADKAIALSGTSFFSRTVKVVKKAAVMAAPEKLSQPSSSMLQRPYTSYRLQWRRESIESV